MRVIRFRRFGQREKDRGSFGPFDGIAEQPVASGTGEGLYAPLHELCECSHKPPYPQELLIRIFSQKAA